MRTNQNVEIAIAKKQLKGWTRLKKKKRKFDKDVNPDWKF